MHFNQHSELEGIHAPFSPSQPYWLNYDDEKLVTVYKNKQAAVMGTRLHEWAKTTIDLGLKQPRSKKTLYAYVNDAIGFNMTTEVCLKYSDYFFGHADAICFRNNFLRIHDLKTGTTSPHEEQLEIYAALFCLEYRIKPSEIKIELRIYQSDDVIVWNPEAEYIQSIMDAIVHKDGVLNEMNNGRL